MGLMRSLRLRSFRLTGSHLGAVQHIPTHLRAFLPTAPSPQHAPWPPEPVRLRLAGLTFGTVRYIVVQGSYSTRTFIRASCFAQTPFTFDCRTQRRRIVLTGVPLREEVTGLELCSFGVWRTLASRGPLRRRCRPLSVAAAAPETLQRPGSLDLPPHTWHI